jgi:hypothetical protein
MNERIRELALQSQKVIWPADGNVTELTSLDEEKFAELIVRECAEIADDYDGVGSTIVSRIKKHFGVEQ